MKSIYFSNFGFFLLSQKLFFPLFLGQVLNYWASFSLFWIDFSSQHLLRLLNFFFFWKTRIIKLLIIYLILKINKYINIKRQCGVVRFMRFSYYKTANRTTPCGVVRYGTLLLAVQCGYAILRAVLVRFLRFVRFGEHPYTQSSNHSSTEYRTNYGVKFNFIGIKKSWECF